MLGVFLNHSFTILSLSLTPQFTYLSRPSHQQAAESLLSYTGSTGLTALHCCA